MSRAQAFGALSVVVLTTVVVGTALRSVKGDVLASTCYIEQGLDVTPTVCPATFQGGLCSAPYTVRVNFAQPTRFTGAPHVLVTPRNVSNQTGCVGTKTDRLVCRPKAIDSTGFTLECSGSPLRDDCGVLYDNYFSYASADWLAVDPSCGARSGHDVQTIYCDAPSGGVCSGVSYSPVNFSSAFQSTPLVFVTPEELTLSSINACAAGTFDAVQCSTRNGSISTSGFTLECSGSPLDTVSTCGTGNGMWAAGKAGWFAMEDRAGCKVLQGSAVTDNCNGTSVSGGLCQNDWQKQIIFPAGAFSAPPFVQVSPRHISAATQCAGGSTEKIVCAAQNVQAAGFMAVCRGMPAGSSCGGSDAYTPAEFNYIAIATSCVGSAPTGSDVAIGGNGFPVNAVAPGNVQVDFTVSNNGPTSAGNVRIIPVFGSNFSFVNITDTSGNVVCNSDINCAIATPGVGQTRNFIMNLNVGGSCPATSNSNSITLQPIGFTDPNTANNATAPRSVSITCDPNAQVSSSSSSAGSDDADCDGYSITNPIGSQTQFTATITMRNKGSSTWVAEEYDLTLVTPTVFQAADYPILIDILPERERTFTVRAVTPFLPGTYPFLWQMRKRNGAAFGETCGGNVRVSPPGTDLEFQTLSGATVLQKGGANAVVQAVVRNRGPYSLLAASGGTIVKLRNLPAGITVAQTYTPGVQCTQSGSTNVYCVGPGLAYPPRPNEPDTQIIRLGLAVAPSVACGTSVTYMGTVQPPFPYIEQNAVDNAKTAAQTGMVQCASSSSSSPPSSAATTSSRSSSGSVISSPPSSAATTSSRSSSATSASAPSSTSSSSPPPVTTTSSSVSLPPPPTYCCNNNQCVQSTSCTLTLAACSALCNTSRASSSLSRSSTSSSVLPLPPPPPPPPSSSLASSRSSVLASSRSPAPACRIDICAAGGNAYCAQLQAVCRRTPEEPCYECVPNGTQVSSTASSVSSVVAQPQLPAAPPPPPPVFQPELTDNDQGLPTEITSSSVGPSVVLQLPKPASSLPSLAVIPPGCGNGITEGGEQCDLGRSNSNTPNAQCRSNCTFARCGDAIVDTRTESCDDGNTLAGDGCDTQCRIVPMMQALPQQVAVQPVTFVQQPLAQLAPVQFAPVSLPAVSVYVPPATTNSGPAAIAVMAAGAAAGMAYARRRRKK